jgi:hypothetical protein
MNSILHQILALVVKQDVLISDHGYDELAADDILVRDVFEGVGNSIVVEEYPNYPKGPCVLVLQRDHESRPIHVLWGIPRDASSPAVIVTAYRPDPKRWAEDFVTRRKP